MTPLKPVQIKSQGKSMGIIKLNPPMVKRKIILLRTITYNILLVFAIRFNYSQEYIVSN